MNARAAAARVAVRLAEAHIPDAAFEAELLVRAAAGISRTAYFAGACLDTAALRRLDELVERRLRREPTAYLIGRREFYGREFIVTPATLIPRPETEILVECALEASDERPGRPTVVDVGTGCGCVAISLALERPRLRVIGTDVSAAAAAVARENARRFGARVDVVVGDLLGAIRTADLVVANLPYIPTAELRELEPELREWEPWVALDGGPTGTTLIERLLEECAARRVPFAAVEVGFGQAAAVKRRAEALGARTDVRRDLADIDRVVIARWV